MRMGCMSWGSIIQAGFTYSWDILWAAWRRSESLSKEVVLMMWSMKCEG